ncbi:vicilin-like seed storage protein At2g18540, partial [Micropterus dolomieu]|uniref:vicilin-like seed storage protein At2g18540 n=1 Tax=Micropterus dolomieu TaxID=147949 RepID=UPI001E8ED1A7
DVGQCISFAAPGPHVFLVVIRLGRFTEEETQTVQKIQEIFGQAADSYSMVLFTGGDLIEDTTIEDFLNESSELQQLVARCNGQYHVFNNNKKEDRSQVTELLQKIRDVVQKNGGHHYTNEMFQEAERAIKEEKQRILKEREEQIREEREKLEREIEEKYEKLMKKITEKLQAERERERREREEERKREKEEMREERKREKEEMNDERKKEREEMNKERKREKEEREEERKRERRETERERNELIKERMRELREETEKLQARNEQAARMEAERRNQKSSDCSIL